MPEYNFQANVGAAMQQYLLDQAARDRQAQLDSQNLAHQQEGERLAREQDRRETEAHARAMELQGADLQVKREQIAETKRKNTTEQLQQGGMGSDVSGQLLTDAQANVPYLIDHKPGTYEQGAQTGEMLPGAENVPLYGVTQTAPERNVFKGTNEQRAVHQMVQEDPTLLANPEVKTILKFAEATGNYAGVPAAIASASRAATETSWQSIVGRRHGAKPGTPDERFSFNPKTKEYLDSRNQPVPEGVDEGAPAPSNYGSTLIRVEHQDPTTHDTVVSFMTPAQIQQAGGTFEKGLGQTVESRYLSAKTVLKQGNDIIAALGDKDIAAQLGPVMGRYNTLREFIGNPPPEFSKLAGQLKSYSYGNMGVHGMRSTQGAEMLDEALDRKMTPEALKAMLEGVNSFAEDLVGFIERVPQSVQDSGGGPAASTSEKPARKKGETASSYADRIVEWLKTKTK